MRRMDLDGRFILHKIIKGKGYIKKSNWWGTKLMEPKQ